jgi:hypothetical protein
MCFTVASSCSWIPSGILVVLASSERHILLS